MIGFDRLMKIRGVVAAGQFTDDGKVIRKVGEFPPEIENSAELCALQNRRSEELVQFLNENTDMEWMPLMGWAIWGGKYTIIVMKNRRVIVETKYADFNELLVSLFDA